MHYSLDEGKKFEAITMLSKSLWNGVNHEDTQWDGNVAAGIAMHLKRLTNYAETYAEKATPQPDWLIVTVDYHS